MKFGGRPSRIRQLLMEFSDDAKDLDWQRNVFKYNTIISILIKCKTNYKMFEITLGMRWSIATNNREIDVLKFTMLFNEIPRQCVYCSRIVSNELTKSGTDYWMSQNFFWWNWNHTLIIGCLTYVNYNSAQFLLSRINYQNHLECTGNQCN